MRKVIFFIFLFSIILISCDGRERIHKSNQEVLNENKLLDSFSARIQYIPEQYTETSTDTTLSNGFRVKIKLFSNMEHGVLNTFKKDNITHKLHYRDSISKIIVLKDGIEIFNKTVDKSFLAQNNDALSKRFFEKATMNSIWLDQMFSNDSDDKIKIDVSFRTVEMQFISTYQIYIDKNGIYNIEEHINKSYTEC